MTEYYIKNSGNDYNSGLSDAEAWRSIGKVNSFSFNDNDTISFKRDNIFTDSTLTLNHTSVGRRGIVIQDYGTGNKPLFNGNIVRPIRIVHALVELTIRNISISGQCRSDITHHNMYLNNVNGLTIDGLNGDGHYNYNGFAEGRSPVGIDRCSGEIEITNCNLHDWGPSVIPSIGIDYNAVTIREHNTGTFLMHNNLIHDIQSSALVQRTSSAPASVYNNTVYNCGQRFVNIKGSKNIEIYNNNAYREPNFIGSGGVDTGVKYPFIGIFTSDDDDHMLTENIVICDNILGPTDGQGIYLSGANEIDKVDNITIENNEIINCNAAFVIGTYVTNVDCYKNIVRGSTWVHIFDWGGELTHNVNFYNNTFYSPKLTRSIYFQSGNTNIYNNIFYDSASKYMIDLISGDPSIYNNLWYNPSYSDYINWKGTIFTSSQQTAWRNAGHPGAIFANPKFVNPVNGDFRLQSDSPAVDVGIDVGLPFLGLAPDIGAIECGLIDLCEGVVCPNICAGNDLWSQRCNPDTGECVLNQLLESNSATCVTDPCTGVVCPDICVGNDLWSQRCNPDTGECMLNQLILQNATNCKISEQVPSDDSTIQTYLILGGLGLLGLTILMMGKKS